MGNRAVITTREKGVGVYLHWNGGRDSVEAFLKYCELKGYRSPSKDCYGWARLCQVIGNFFGGGTSIGIDTIDKLDCDNWDNGTYIIDGWEIVGREYFKGYEQNEYDMNEMLMSIDEAQPEKERLGDFLLAKEIPTNELQIGDTIFMKGFEGEPYKKFQVVGFGEDKYRNGHNVKGAPYVNKYDHDGDYSWNVNNYIFEETVRIVKE